MVVNMESTESVESIDKLEVIYKSGRNIVKNKPIFSFNGQYLFVVVHNYINIYYTETGKLVRKCEQESQCPIVDLCLSPENDKILISCSSDGNIIFWKWKTGMIHKTIKLEKNVKDFSVLKDDIMLVSVVKSKKHLQIMKFNSENNFEVLKTELRNREHRWAVGVNTNILAIVQKKRLHIQSLNDYNKSFTVKKQTQYYTTVCCHPIEESVATCTSIGEILIYRNIFDRKPCVSKFHWHSTLLKSIAFSPGGTHIFSGGQENVLVKWIAQSQSKKFLPRLPANIEHISVSEDNMWVAVSLADNEIQIVDTQLRLKSVIQHISWSITSPQNGDSLPAGLTYDQNSEAIILNSRTGHIQFFSVKDDSVLYHLDVSNENQLPEERKHVIVNFDVVKLAITTNGSWLATAEQRNDPKSLFESRIKFWNYDNTQQKWLLNTFIQLPHEKNINGLAFQPLNKISENKFLMCISISDDGNFKIWSLVLKTTVNGNRNIWINTYCGNYCNEIPRCMDFSFDGSLVAIGYGPCLTLFAPENCEFKTCLKYTPFAQNLTHVLWGTADQSHMIVTTTKERLFVWNLLSMSLTWTVKLNVSILCRDITSDLFAVFTDNSKLFIFSPTSARPVFKHENIVTNDVKIVRAIFVPMNNHTNQYPWASTSQLFFINNKQELLSLENDLMNYKKNFDYSLEVVKETKTNNMFSKLQAEKTLNYTSQEFSNSVTSSRKGLPGSVNISTLIKLPCHTCAPMKFLCESVIKSLITTQKDPNVDKSFEDNDDEAIAKNFTMNSFTENVVEISDDDDDSSFLYDESDAIQAETMETNAKSKSEINSTLLKDIKETTNVLNPIVKQNYDWCSILVEED